MKNAILAGSIAGALLIGADANATDRVSSDKLAARVTAEELYRETVNKNVKQLVSNVTPEGIRFEKFDSRMSMPNGVNGSVKVGSISRGFYVALDDRTSEGKEPSLYLGVGQRVTSTQGLVGDIIKDKAVEVQLRYRISF